MNVTAAIPPRTVLVLGAPRSGTTWLGKLFDSSPDVLYRHEPDMLVDTLPPRVITHEPNAAECREGASCLDAMVGGRYLKSVGKMPIFPKNFRSSASQRAYRTMLLGLHLVQRLPGAGSRMAAWRAPDLVSPRRAEGLTVAVKSISSLGRVNLFARARPGMRILLILRDPFGQIASMVRGIALGKFEREVVLDECLDTQQSAGHGLTRAAFGGLSQVEQLAWYWVLMNDKAIADLRGNADAMVVCYNDLVREPERLARTIFAFCGLRLEGQAATFLRDSTHSVQADDYYQVYKRGAEGVDKWRSQLSAEDQRRIHDIVVRSDAWAMHPVLRTYRV